MESNVLCLRKELFEKKEYLNKTHLLLSCAWCNSINSKNTENIFVNKYMDLFVLPLFIVERNRREEHVLFRTIGILMLEKLQEKFGTVDSYSEEDISSLLDAYQRFAENPNDKILNKKLFKQFKNISECSYIEILKRIIFDENYDVAIGFVMLFFDINTIIHKQGFRTYIYYARGDIKNNEHLFFDIGVSLDEGQTELVAQEITKSMRRKLKEKGEDVSDVSYSAYHTEVAYIKRLHKKFSKELFIKASFDQLPADFFYELTESSSNACDFYNIFKHTDNQNWREAMAILNRLNSPRREESNE